MIIPIFIAALLLPGIAHAGDSWDRGFGAGGEQARHSESRAVSNSSHGDSVREERGTSFWDFWSGNYRVRPSKREHERAMRETRARNQADWRDPGDH